MPQSRPFTRAALFTAALLAAAGLSFALLTACTSAPPAAELEPGVRALGPEAGPAALQALIADLAALAPEAQESRVLAWRAEIPAPGLPWVEEGQVTFVYWAPAEAKRAFLDASFTVSGPDGLHRAGSSRLWYKTYAGVAGRDLRYRFQYEVAPDSFGRAFDPWGRDLDGAKTPYSRLRGEPAMHGRLTLIPRDQAPPRPEPLRPRDLWVWLPPGYDANSETRYPVMYFADGQNLWDEASLPYGGWKLDTTLEGLIAEGKIRPMIVVGIPNSGTDRGGEYMGWGSFWQMEVPEARRAEHERLSRLGPAYQSWVVETVKPWIDARYRTLPDPANTGHGGSSFGAGIGLTLGLRFPQVFGRVAALSAGHYDPTMAQWRDRPFNLYPLLAETAKTAPKTTRIWLDCGLEDLDASFVVWSRRLNGWLVEAGFTPGQNLFYREFPGTGHNEGDWADRLAEVLTTLWAE